MTFQIAYSLLEQVGNFPSRTGVEIGLE